MTEIKFRKAVLGDLDAIERVFLDAIAHMDSTGIHQWDEVYPTRDIFRDDIINDELIVGTVQNEIIVCFTLNTQADEEYSSADWSSDSYLILHRLCVSPNWQNQGVAVSAMSEAERIARSSCVKSIRLDCFSENHYSNMLYLHAGYRHTGETVWRKGTFFFYEKLL